MADFKRNLSEVSVEASALEYTKFRIELEAEVEELRAHKHSLDVEREEETLDDKIYWKNHMETNRRIDSLGNDLWRGNRFLRQIHQKEGRVPELGPDSEGAFVNTLLTLYKDPTISHGRCSTIQTEMKDAAVLRYGANLDAPKGKLWCCISQDWFDSSSIHAAHIVPHASRPSLVDYIFGAGSSARLNTADNCLLVHETVERSFDNGNFVLLPVDPRETPIKRWKVQITNNAAVNTDFGRTSLKEFNGKEIAFKTDARPASRFLYYHFVVTLLRNKRDRQPGWENYLMNLPFGRSFATIGKYVRHSMLLALARYAGDLERDEEARLLGDGARTFVEKEKLSDKEETEIARQIMAAHDSKETEGYPL